MSHYLKLLSMSFFRLLGKTKKVKYESIIKTMRTYGVYFPKGGRFSGQLREIFEHNGFPAHFLQTNDDMVFLCIERIKKEIEEVLAEDPSLDVDAMSRNLITSTLVHEHAHGITYQGIDRNGMASRWKSKDYDNDHFSAINESLAEWAEYNFFRYDDEMMEIIREHAQSGEFPVWEYAGMLLIEKYFNVLYEERFRSILNYFRLDVNEAYKHLLKGEKKNCKNWKESKENR